VIQLMMAVVGRLLVVGIAVVFKPVVEGEPLMSVVAPRKTNCPSGLNCGSIDDGCGGTISCGGCTADLQTCGGGGTPNVCGCTPKSNCPSGLNCDSIDDGCGGQVSCGVCTVALQTCGGAGTPNVCGQACTKNTCAVGACGIISDGCGGELNCGSCTSPQNCGGGGTDNVCGCKGLTVCPSNLNCGSIPDNCGGTISCGNCQASNTCGVGGNPNVCGCQTTTSAPTITITASPNATTQGQSVTFTATLHFSSPLGTLTSSDFALEQQGNGRIYCATEILSQTSNTVTFTCTSRTLPLGDHKYIASFNAGGSCVAPADSLPVKVKISNK